MRTLDAAIDGKLLGDGALGDVRGGARGDRLRNGVHIAGGHTGLPRRMGIHAGDVIRGENNVYGGAVNIASRVADEAAAGETLASNIVRGLARTSAEMTSSTVATTN